jgi:signal peptidase II
MNGADRTAAGAGAAAGATTASKALIFLGIIAAVVALDYITKMWIQQNMHLYQQIDLVGDYVRLTYIHNPGAAFGIQLGRHSRMVFLILSLVALVALAVMFWFTSASNRTRLVALALICGGAVGNLIDRIRIEAGVVDFVDIGIGDIRWPVFNVADIAVTSGAIFLALSLWRDERTEDPGRRRG